MFDTCIESRLLGAISLRIDICDCVVDILALLGRAPAKSKASKSRCDIDGAKLSDLLFGGENVPGREQVSACSRLIGDNVDDWLISLLDENTGRGCGFGD